jgi:ArsR family transcriptional regulator
VLDIGTGTGRMIELFGGEADHFIALDNNVEMLRLARAKLAGLPNASHVQAHTEVILGDFNLLPFDDAHFDTVLLHQVLHYAQTPDRAIAEAARVLRPGGRLVVVDFDNHDVEELRSIHAHARLGFADDMMTQFFSASGLQLSTAQTLEGGKLAVKIWLGTKPAVASRGQSEAPKLRIIAS